MAAKEEAAILKHLKKNPSQDALDISFATDLDEGLIKESLVALEGKAQVESKEVDGRLQWSLAAPKPKPVAAPAPKAEAPAVSDDEAPVSRKSKPVAVEADDDEDAPAVGGASKGFVLTVGLVVLLLAVAAGYVLGGMQASSAAKALADGEVKAVRDSIGLVKVSLNTRIDALESKIRDLKAPPAPVAAATEKDAKASKAVKAKPVKKGKKK